MVKTPACVFSDLSKLSRSKQAYFSELYKYPTDAEFATLTGLTIARVKYLKDIDFEVVSTEDKPDETLPGVYEDIITSPLQPYGVIQQFKLPFKLFHPA